MYPLEASQELDALDTAKTELALEIVIERYLPRHPEIGEQRLGLGDKAFRESIVRPPGRSRRRVPHDDCAIADPTGTPISRSCAAASAGGFCRPRVVSRFLTTGRSR